MKRVLEANLETDLLTLDQVSEYAILHEHVTSIGASGTWEHDKKHVLNALMCVVPREKFVWQKALKKEHYAKMRLFVDDHDCGTLDTPNLTQLLALGKKATFGKGNKEVYDVTVRDALAIDGARITVKGTYGTYQAPELFRFLNTGSEFEKWCGAKPSHVTLYKLHIYPKGGKFDTHVDTPHADNHIASALFVLGTAFSGGALVIEHGDQVARVQEPGTLAAWYTDCPHRVEEVTDGTRVVLQFDVLTQAKLPEEKKDAALVKDGEASDDDDESSDSDDEDKRELHPYFGTDHAIVSEEWKKRFLGAIQHELDKGHDVALLLEHMYYSATKCPLPDLLKGRDRLLWSVVSGASETICAGLVAILSESKDQYDNEIERSIGPLTAVPNDSKRPVRFIPGPNSHLFKVIDNPGAEHAGNEPLLGESAYLGIVIYCTTPVPKKEE